jgi:predicted MFS family arabinose efflux permease
MPRQAVANEIRLVFVPRVAAGVVILLLVFGVAAAFLVSRGSGSEVRVRAVAFGLVFFLMAAVVVSALVDVYSDGIRNKTRALADSLSARVEAPLALGLQLDDFSQLDRVFAEYRTLYPDLSYVALTQGDDVLIDTDHARVGSAWTPYPAHYEYAAPVSHSEQLAVRAGIPEAIIYEQIWRSAKNFFVLFLASGLLAIIFFELLTTFTRRAPAAAPVASRPAAQRAFQENIILPILFFAIFIEALTTSFMPQHLQQVARASGADTGIVSAQFTVYYVALAIALLPVGRFIDSGKMKWVLLLAVILEVVSLVLMATVTNVYAMFGVRAMAGAAHGIMATGAQAYLLLLAAHGRMTRGASRFLFTYNSGMIAGTAIGALLAVYLGFTGVFALGAALVIPVLLFAARYLPRSLDPDESGVDVAPTRASQPAPLLPSLASAVRDPGFASAVLFVGVPAKIANAGVIAFALPLLLAREAVPQEDIGQIIMFYPIGILLMSLVVARVVERLGQPRKALLLGTAGGALGVVVVGVLSGALSLPESSSPVALLLVVGLFVLGLAHGMINAPIVTHVASTEAADRLGRSTVTSVYRFVERSGHMIGPILVSQLLILSQQDPGAITWIALPTIVLGLAFWLQSGRRLAPSLKPATA